MRTTMIPALLLAAEWWICFLFAAVGPAAEPPAAAAAGPDAPVPNAAVIHWQAFAVMPQPLAEPLKTKYDAAVAAPAAPVPADLEPVIEGFRLALGELHRAARVAPCDWNLDYEAGVGCLLPHLEKARTLSKGALLRARLSFAKGKTDEAVADVLAVLKLARDCGRSPVLVSLLVDAAIEKSAGEVLAANLGRLSPAQLDGLAAALDGLPAPPAVAECVRQEGRMFGDWLGRRIDAEAARVADPQAGGRVLEGLLESMLPAADARQTRERERLEKLSVADVRESLRLLREDYARFAEIAGLPMPDRRERFAEIEKRPAATAGPAPNPRFLSALLLPAVSKVCERGDDAFVRRRLLAAAIDVRRRGPDAVRGLTLPGHGAIEHRATAAGFELRCQPDGTGEPVVLEVGPGA